MDLDAVAASIGVGEHVRLGDYRLDDVPYLERCSILVECFVGGDNFCHCWWELATSVLLG